MIEKFGMTKSFTEFEVYQKSIVLAKEVFRLMESPGFQKEYGFKDQIKRAVVSISNNIAEVQNTTTINNLSGFWHIQKVVALK
jgi:four helix bundle protein